MVPALHVQVDLNMTFVQPGAYPYLLAYSLFGPFFSLFQIVNVFCICGGDRQGLARHSKLWMDVVV